MMKFYTITKNNAAKENEYELEDLGEEVAYITVGTRGSDFWSTRSTQSKTSYIKTSPEHYDNEFIGTMHKD